MIRTPSDNILHHLERGTLLRHDFGDGRDTACLISAAHPPCAAAESPALCPAELMPAWLAYLTPFIDDRGSDAAWEPTIRRYAALMARWHVLSPEAWERAHRAVKVAILVEAKSHVTVDTWGVTEAIDAVIAWLEKGAPEAKRGGVRKQALIASATVDADASADATAAAAADAATVATASVASVDLAARSAARAAAHATRAGDGATCDAVDRITAAFFDILEREISHAEVAA